MLVVGPDAISGATSTSTALAVYASKGHAVIVLDQSEPLKYQAVPAEMDLAPVSRKNDFGTEVPTAQGSTAYIEDTSHPALSGLQDKDFFTWGPGQPVYRHVYTKPTRGAKSLVQTGPRLAYSALVEVPVAATAAPEGVGYSFPLNRILPFVTSASIMRPLNLLRSLRPSFKTTPFTCISAPPCRTTCRA